MEIQYEITADDVPKILNESHKRTAFYTVQTLVSAAFGLLFVSADIILTIVAMFKNDGAIRLSDPQILVRLAISIGIVAVTSTILMVAGKFTMKNAFQSPGTNGLFCQHTIVMDEKGFTESTEVNKSFHAWEGVEKVLESANFVILQIRLGTGYHIPKRAFASAEELNGFVSLAQGYISEHSHSPR